ncbi:hypothetical protein [Paludibacterium denitrificans]|uniref:Uncharacterized protein n=1 Tax=Paludibacterium denitrificans TaxID=2675226 RepID=A0A844G8R3_9NEIS|nr:hypothetical protein [Paludibacterium denitrificans]MTD32786.1 hypothetical protein [Paludibacterium denitrificans]
MLIVFVQFSGKPMGTLTGRAFALLCTVLSTNLSTAFVDVAEIPLQNHGLANFLETVCEPAPLNQEKNRRRLPSAPVQR